MKCEQLGHFDFRPGFFGRTDWQYGHTESVLPIGVRMRDAGVADGSARPGPELAGSVEGGLRYEVSIAVDTSLD